MLSQPQLETQRLSLRPLTFADASLIQKVASVRQIADSMISIPHPYPDGEAERYISKQISEFKESRSVTFAIEQKPEKLFSGIIEMRDIEREHSQAELSFWLAVEAWGQGYMSEALKPVLGFGFEELSLNRLYAYHMARNPASGNVLKKNGFIQEGLLRQRVRKWGVFEDVVLLAILRDDWENVKQCLMTESDRFLMVAWQTSPMRLHQWNSDGLLYGKFQSISGELKELLLTLEPDIKLSKKTKNDFQSFRRRLKKVKL